MGFPEQAIEQLFGEGVQMDMPLRAVGGGCINNTGIFGVDGISYFLKWNENATDLFEKEKRGLELLADYKVIGVPTVVGMGRVERIGYLCMQHIEKGPATSAYWESFGSQLATLHKITHSEYGLDFDNHIGRLPQSNSKETHWVDFFVNQRIVPQVKMARRQQLLGSALIKEFDELYTRLERYFPKEKPALLHGDLWSGNIMAGQNDEPFIFDPAVYYGHREAELAFTHMFGGFDRLFYETYHECFPIEAGFDDRIDLYNLYPLLVHLNLFGTSYLSGIRRVLDRFV